jgi:hypothetical protein
MSGVDKERWPWLTGRRMLAIVGLWLLLWIGIGILNAYFDTLWWREMKDWFSSHKFRSR